MSEFVVYVCNCEEKSVDFPFIGCFRRPSPFGKGNFPLVDVRLFKIGESPDDDQYQLQEIKTTRRNPSYFRDTIKDFQGLYSKSRLYDSAEHTKADLANAGLDHLIPRLNDCLGTCPEDSNKVEVVPTGVSCSSCDEESGVVELQEIVGHLLEEKWPNVSALYFSIPDIEKTYLSFATGEGNHA